MRQPPRLDEDNLIACLHSQYGLNAVSVRFLPIGYDLNAFVYEAVTAEGAAYFVKIRRGTINPLSLLVPRLLLEHGIPNILAPIRTLTQEPSWSMDVWSVVVYPFIHGENAMIAGLTDSQWQEFGATLKAIHTGGFAALLAGQAPAETFSIPSVRLVRQLSAHIESAGFESPAAAQFAAFWHENALLIRHLLERAEALGKELQSRTFELVLCHADIHAANILVSADNRIYLVDWDDPLLAPVERDLLFIVGSRIARAVEPHEEALFFQGYGAVDIDLTALAYYRYERVLEDIGETGRSVFLATDLSEESKAAEMEMFRSQFDPGSMVESAMEADRNRN